MRFVFPLTRDDMIDMLTIQRDELNYIRCLMDENPTKGKQFLTYFIKNLKIE